MLQRLFAEFRAHLSDKRALSKALVQLGAKVTKEVGDRLGVDNDEALFVALADDFLEKMRAFGRGMWTKAKEFLHKHKDTLKNLAVDAVSGVPFGKALVDTAFTAFGGKMRS